MQFRLPAAVLVFLASYLPLSLILLAQDYDYSKPPCWGWLWKSETCIIPLRNPICSLGILAICAVCFILTLVVLSMLKPKTPIHLTEVKYVPADLMNYTLPYVVSFMSIEYQDRGKFIGLIIFLGWMFWITHRAGQIILNPLLIVFGWRLYEIKYRYVGSDTSYTNQALVSGEIAPNEDRLHIAIQDIVVIKASRRD